MWHLKFVPIFRFVFFSIDVCKCCCFLRSNLRNCSNAVDWMSHCCHMFFFLLFLLPDTIGLKTDLSVFFRGNHNANVLELNARINITWYLNQLARAQQKHHVTCCCTLFSERLRNETKQNKRQMFMHSNEPSKLSTICTFAFGCCYFFHPSSSSTCSVHSIPISRYLILWTVNNSQHFMRHSFCTDFNQNVRY